MNPDLPIARTIRRILSTGLLATALFTAANNPASAQHYEVGPLVLHDPWARATPPGATVGGGYATIENTSDTPDRLISVTAPEVSGRPEIHEMATTDGVMTMRPLPEGLEIPAGDSVELKPGSFHIMLMALTHPLVEGETFDATLTFEKAGSIDVTFVVGPIGSAEAPLHDDGMMGGEMEEHDGTAGQ